MEKEFDWLNVNDMVEECLKYLDSPDYVTLVSKKHFTMLKDLVKKYKWLYHVVCLALHDISELPLEEIKKDFEHLWDLKSAREENKKNVN